jgi:hypothetical protein
MLDALLSARRVLLHQLGRPQPARQQRAAALGAGGAAARPPGGGVGRSRGGRTRTTLQHPLQPFSRRYFEAAVGRSAGRRTAAVAVGGREHGRSTASAARACTRSGGAPAARRPPAAGRARAAGAGRVGGHAAAHVAALAGAAGAAPAQVPQPGTAVDAPASAWPSAGRCLERPASPCRGGRAARARRDGGQPRGRRRAPAPTRRHLAEDLAAQPGGGRLRAARDGPPDRR